MDNVVIVHYSIIREIQSGIIRYPKNPNFLADIRNPTDNGLMDWNTIFNHFSIGDCNDGIAWKSNKAIDGNVISAILIS
ncbi:hypothetical protein RIR_jg5613.t1 [Rhizophagus irregularis DAOM 181602=DAOM 197198]|nr:hypothetical protein RIR_jg5613.t1 [Rhizophagus irregularis DAOM 181602=DAOM 197198]